MDALFHALMKQRRVPALRIVPPYYDHPAYLEAVATVIREAAEEAVLNSMLQAVTTVGRDGNTSEGLDPDLVRHHLGLS